MHSGLLIRIGVGGVFGAAARWGLAEAITGGTLPWALLLANTVGCAVLGAAAFGRSDEVRGALGAGIAGGLTSMSALALWLAQRLEAGEVGESALTVLLMLGLGVAAYLGAERLANSVVGADAS